MFEPNPGRQPSANDTNVGVLQIGSFIGGTYRVLDFIGQGGMGFVYKVEHLMMAKILALKVLRSEQVSEEVWKRFRIEAQAIARLDHANVVRIYDMSQTEAGLPYYTMDLLVGESLADYLEEYYRLPLSDALPIFRQVCAGLAYAHDRGIIHRDIKPGNIMLLAEDRENTLSRVGAVVKIVDFGIAKLSSFDSGFGQGLTRPGEVFGSPLYMSPEQCSGQQLDHRTDMYSVGVTMFQALTGRPPLLGKTAIETTAMHQSAVPPAMADVIVLDEGEEPIVFPPELEEIVARLLAKSPDGRYDSLADVASELLALERGEIRRGQGGPATSDVAKMAQYAVAEAARRKASYSKTQVLTSGQSDTDSGADAGGRNQLKYLLVGLALVAVIAGSVAFAILKEKQVIVKVVTVSKTDKIDAFESPVPAEAIKDLVDSGTESAPDQVSPAEAKQIKSFIASKSDFYSRLIREGGRESYVFDFPPDFSLGTLVQYRVGDPPYATDQAKGTLKLLKTTNMLLNAQRAVGVYPELLKYFRPDELSEIDLNGITAKSSKLLPALRQFTDLSRLELKDTNLNASDVVELGKLNTVRQLAISNSGLPGSALARCNILPNLNVLEVDKVKDITPLLKRLSAINHLEVLVADFDKLNAQDFVYLSKMTNLTNLSLKETSITDADLALLLNLRKMKELELNRCNSLTLKAAESLSKFKNLEKLTLPDHLDDPALEATLRKNLLELHILQ